MSEQAPSNTRVSDAFNKAVDRLGELFSWKQLIREIGGQQAGLERYRLTFSGQTFSEVNELLHDLGVAIRESTAPEPTAAPNREHLRSALGCFMVENDMNADNIAVVLCTYFEGHMDRPKPDPQSENGWGAWAEQNANRVLDEVTDQILMRLVRASQPPSPVHSGMVDYMQRYFFEIHGLKYSRADVRTVLETAMKQPDPSCPTKGGEQV